MSTIRLPEFLTVESWERNLGVDDGPLNNDGSWSDEALYEGIHLDFSVVEFAYLGALARALLLLDAAVRDGVPVTVMLPNGPHEAAGIEPFAVEVTDGSVERRWARKARARAEALAFMSDVGFTKALHAAHWPSGAVEVTDADGTHDNAAESTGNYDHAFDLASRLDGEEFRPRRIVPFRWLSRDHDVEQMFKSATRRLLDIGLSAADSRAVGHALMTELFDNVDRHAGTDRLEVPHALVAGVLVGDWLYASRQTQLPPAADPLIDLLRQGTGRYVLDLVVGDSGQGLVRRQTGDEATREAANRVVLATFDGRLTATDGHRREANGLWRVAHLVRGYRGTVQVSTAGIIAGKVYALPGAPDVQSYLPATAPGTLVEVTLPIAETAPRAEHAPWLGRSSLGEAARLGVLACKFDTEHGLGHNDLRLAKIAHGAEDTEGVVLTVPVRSARAWLPDGAMSMALTRVVDLAQEPPLRFVAVLFPDADPQIVDLTVAGVNATRAEDTSPVLVLGAAGPPHWCGGPSPMRNVLDALTAAGGVLTAELVERAWKDGGGSLDDLAAGLAAHAHLISAGETETLLRVSAADVVRATREWAAVKLAEQVGHGGAGVAVGHFRTPTLRRTNRWISADPLVAATIGTELTAWLLARQVEECVVLPARSGDPMAVARVAAAVESISRLLSECLSVGGRFYEMPGELDLEGIQVSDQVPHHANVVLCTDIVSSENAVRRAVTAVVNKGAVPVAIVCVVDSRSDRKPIRMFNRDIPVLSLVAADLAAGGDERSDPVDIDPLLLDPVRVAPQTTGRTLIDEETVLDWCREADWLRLGHVERVPGTRHFSAYLQFASLFKQPAIASQLREVVRSAIGEVVQLWSNGTQTADPFGECQIWYPGPEVDYAALLAQLVSDVLTADGREVDALRAVPRAMAGVRWTFPASLDVRPAPGTVIVVDWGTQSSTSLNQMIRLATESGATAILVLVLLNQLDDQEADALRGIGATQSTRSGVFGPMVPTQVRFLATSSLGGVSAQNCSLCEMRRRAAIIIENAPSALREHAKQLRERTRVRSRKQVFSSPAADVFNVPVNSHDLADYLRWRGLFVRALRVTEARQEVMERLKLLESRDAASLDGLRWTRRNLLRLAAAEEQWLKLPPLRFEEARDLLARICTVVLRQPPTTSPWLRAQAVMVMVASAPGELVRLLPRLIARTIDEPVLINHLLLECHRILDRSAADSPVDLDEMRLCLQRCRNTLESMLDEHDSVVRKYLRVLKQLIAVLDAQTKRKPRSAQEAWYLLQEDFQRHVETHSMEATVLRVRDFVEDLVVRPAPSHRIAEAAADWERCATQLRERVMVSLSALTEVLAGDYVGDRLGLQEQRNVLAIAEGSGVRELREVEDLLHELEELPWDNANEEWSAKRAKLHAKLLWWHQMFMAPHVSGTTSAPVVELVRSMPAEPAESVERILRPKHPGLSVVNPAAGMGNRVFCPVPLLDNILEHVLNNLSRHSQPGQVVNLEVEHGVRDGLVDLVVRNSGTRPRLPAGHGMRALNEKLRPFGGSLEGMPSDRGVWSFTTKVTFALWRGV
ncbi:hypothetical protein [Lentzea sp. NPDC055074]